MPKTSQSSRTAPFDGYMRIVGEKMDNFMSLFHYFAGNAQGSYSAHAPDQDFSHPKRITEFMMKDIMKSRGTNSTLGSLLEHSAACIASIVTLSKTWNSDWSGDPVISYQTWRKTQYPHMYVDIGALYFRNLIKLQAGSEDLSRNDNDMEVLKYISQRIYSSIVEYFSGPVYDDYVISLQAARKMDYTTAPLIQKYNTDIITASKRRALLLQTAIKDFQSINIQADGKRLSTQKVKKRVRWSDSDESS